MLSPHKYYYLVGQNIQSSLSPLLHNTLFQVKNKPNNLYSIYLDNQMPNMLGGVPESENTFREIKGVSLTIPFKSWFWEMRKEMQRKGGKANDFKNVGVKVQYRGKFAEETGVVNTLVRGDKELFFGYNTDVYGVAKCLERIGVLDNVVVLGAGATSTTFLHYLQSSPNCSRIYLHNRSPARIQSLLPKYPKIHPISISTFPSTSPQINLLINTIPSQAITQNPQVYKSLIDGLNLHEECKLMDVNYRGKSAVLGLCDRMKEVEGARGIDMLVWQAVLQNQLFCGQGDEQCGERDGEMEREKEEKEREGFYRVLSEIVKSVPALTA